MEERVLHFKDITFLIFTEYSVNKKIGVKKACQN